MKMGKIIISTILAGTIITMLMLGLDFVWYLFFPQYSILSIPGMRSVDDPLMSLYFLHPFVLALAFSIAFPFFKEGFKKTKPFKRGIHFGLLMWILITLPSMFLIYSSMNYGETFLLTTTINQLIEFTAAGSVISFLFTRK